MTIKRSPFDQKFKLEYNAQDTIMISANSLQCHHHTDFKLQHFDNVIKSTPD